MATPESPTPEPPVPESPTPESSIAEPPAPEPVPPDDHMSFGHFQVPRKEDGAPWELGRGAMGVTYKAFDSGLRIDVALKVITAERVRDDDTRRRFLREARAAAKIRHPNVASVLYLGVHGGEFFYAMEFVPGRTLEELLKEKKTLPPVVALALAAQIASGLASAHRQQVLHRDLKPANVMLLENEATDQDERTAAAGHRLVKVIDFGLARRIGESRPQDSIATHLQTAGFIGSPAYASAEQCAGADDLDGRSDIYSLGVILWQMLTGRLPFVGTVGEVLGKQQFMAPPVEQLTGVPASVIALLGGTLQKVPDRRIPQSIAELRENLDACRRALQLKEGLHETQALPSPGEHGEAEATTIGTSLSTRYRLGRDLGDGDGGRLFLAADNTNDSMVAVKLLHAARIASEADFLPMTERAVELAHQEQHPNVLAHHVLQRSGFGAFYVREWADGFSLLELLRERHGALRIVEIFRLLADLPGALDFTAENKFPLLTVSLHKLFVVPQASAGGTTRALSDSPARARPVDTWPEFSLKLNPIGFRPPASTESEVDLTMTRVPERATSTFKDPLTGLAWLVRDLLGAAPGNLAPLAELGGEGNALLRRCLGAEGGSRIFGNCVSFWQALQRAVVTPSETSSSPASALSMVLRTLIPPAPPAPPPSIATHHARELLRAAKDSTRGIVQPVERASVLSDIVREHALTADWGDARSTADQITEPYFRSYSFYHIACAQAAGGKLPESLRTLRSTDDPYFLALGLSDIAREQAGAGQTREALDTATGIADTRDLYRAWASISAAEAKNGQIASAKNIANDIGDTFQRARALGEIAGVQLAASDLEGARATLAQSRGVAAGIPDVVQQVRVLLAYAGQCLAATDPAAARDGLNMAHLAVARARHPLQKAAVSRTVAEIESLIGEHAAAIKTASSIEDPSGRAFALVSIAQAAIRTDGAEATRQALGNALHATGDLAGAADQVHLLAAIAATAFAARAAEDGQTVLTQARGLVSSIPSSSAKAAALAAVAEVQASQGDLQEARNTIESIKNGSDKIRSLVSIAQRQAETGDEIGAQATLADAEKVAGMISGDAFVDTRAKTLALADLAWAKARAENLAAAEQWVKTLGSRWARSRCYLALAALAGEAAMEDR